MGYLAVQLGARKSEEKVGCLWMDGHYECRQLHAKLMSMMIWLVVVRQEGVRLYSKDKSLGNNRPWGLHNMWMPATPAHMHGGLSAKRPLCPSTQPTGPRERTLQGQPLSTAGAQSTRSQATTQLMLESLRWLDRPMWPCNSRSANELHPHPAARAFLPSLRGALEAGC